MTGAPSSGRTTVIKKILQRINCPVTGFYTEEERVGGIRCGFMMRTTDGLCAYLAHQDIPSEYRIRRFGVSIENIETVAISSITLKEGYVIILDEIGKMECFSPKFITAAQWALDSENIVIGTITLGYANNFIRAVKERDDIEIIEVTGANRDVLPEVILDELRHSLQSF